MICPPKSRDFPPSEGKSPSLLLRSRPGGLTMHVWKEGEPPPSWGGEAAGWGRLEAQRDRLRSCCPSDLHRSVTHLQPADGSLTEQWGENTPHPPSTPCLTAHVGAPTPPPGCFCSLEREQVGRCCDTSRTSQCTGGGAAAAPWGVPLGSKGHLSRSVQSNQQPEGAAAATHARRIPQHKRGAFFPQLRVASVLFEEGVLLP